jgi:hypothetical protein
MTPQSAFAQAAQFIQQLGGGQRVVSPVPPAQTMQPLGAMPSLAVQGAQVGPNYEAMIRQTYQKYGATPDLMQQVPAMAKQVQKNPYLYPYYPAIPIAETSGGKHVSYPGNYFNLGVTLKPYPLTNQTPQYITERTAWRMTTDPRYQGFRQNPSVQALQPIYAPAESNPHWAGNMQAAVKLFPTITP